MTQHSINMRNLMVLVESEKEMQLKIQELQEKQIDINRLVTNLIVEVQELKTRVNISKVMGATQNANN